MEASTGQFKMQNEFDSGLSLQTFLMIISTQHLHFWHVSFFSILKAALTLIPDPKG